MDKPKVGVGVIILRENKVLMQKRINSHGNNTWSFPGGHLEFKESIFECAKRELKEEMGINIINPRIGTFTNDIFLKENKHYITIFVVGNYAGIEPKILEPSKCASIDWFDWNNLPSPLFLPIENLLKQNYNPFEKNIKFE